MSNRFLLLATLLFIPNIAQASCETERRALATCEASAPECLVDSDCSGAEICRSGQCSRSQECIPTVSCGGCLRPAIGGERTRSCTVIGCNGTVTGRYTEFCDATEPPPPPPVSCPSVTCGTCRDTFRGYWSETCHTVSCSGQSSAFERRCG